MKFSENLNLPILQDGDKYSKDIQNEAFNTIDRECTNIKNTIKSVLDVSEDVVSAVKSIGDISEELSDLKEKQNEDYWELLESNNYIGDKIRDINSQLDNMTNKNPLYAFDFGAKGDGSTNDTLALQNAINEAISKKEKLILNKGTYLVSQLIINNTIFIEGANVVIKSVNNNTSSSIIKIMNNGVNNSQLKNINIDGNKANNTNNINGIEITSDVYSDTFSLLDDINVYNCTGNGIYITGSYQRSSIRELKISNANIYNCNGNGLLADSFTDSFIYNSVFHSNGLNGILLETTGSIKLNNIKCYFNGRKGNDVIEDSRIPSGVSEADKSKYLSKACGIKLNNCTLTMITSSEMQDNAGDGIYVINSTQTQIINVSCDNNGLLFGDDFISTSYSSNGMVPYFYGIYVKNSNFSNIIANFNNHFYDTHGYTQKSSILLSNSNTNNIIANVRLQSVPIVVENIEYNTNSILINGNHYKMDIDLSLLTIADGYTLINNNWNGSYMYVKNNILYFKLAIKKDDYFPTTAVSLITLPAGFRPKTYTKSVIAFMSKNYADDNDGNVVNSYFDANGVFHFRQTNSNMKILNIQGTIDLNI